MLLIVLCLATVASAQENASPEQLRKMYDDALGQLKAAQDRKNELAAENEKLGAKVAELTRDLKGANDRLAVLERESAEFAGRTFDLRSRQAAWARFIAYFPELKMRWETYVDAMPFEMDSAAGGE